MCSVSSRPKLSGPDIDNAERTTGGAGGQAVVSGFWANRKCGDRKFSLDRIIDRAEDIQSGHTRSDKLLWRTVDQSATTIPVRRLLSLFPSPFFEKFPTVCLTSRHERSRVIEKQARKLYQLCGNYFPRYCHRSCALLNKQLIVHGVNLYEILLRELGRATFR